MNLFAIFSKTGKGVQEASGKTSHLSRADRNVLKEIDGKTSLANISAKFEKIPADKFDALIQQLDKDGYIREVSSGVQQAATPAPRPAAPAAKAPPPKADDGDEALDFTQAVKIPPKAPAAPAGPKPPPVDLAAAARADTDRKAKEQQAFDYKARQEADAKAKTEADAKVRADAELRARANAEAKARAEAESKAHAEAEAKARAEADAKTHAEADAKVKAAREAAVRMATEAKARAEADSRAKSAELNAKLDAERKAREDAERRASEAAEVARKELEEKAKRDAEELRQRLEAEMKAKLDEERKAREAEDRKRREEEDRKRAEEDRKRREEDERRRKEEEERRAKEDAERKARDEEDRKRREADERRRKEDEARRAKEDAERRELEETGRKMRAEEDRKRAEEERKRREDDERRAKEDAERKARDEADAKARAAQAAAASASLPAIEAVKPPPPAAPAAGGGIGDSLLADLDSFGQREEEEQRAKEEAERKAREEAARKAKEAADRKAKEEAERKRREDEERRRKEEEARRAEEEAERKAKEEEERRAEEEAERKRKAKESMAAKQAEEKAARAVAGKSTASSASAAKGGDDIVVSDDDLDTDDLKRDQKVAAEMARKAAREQPVVAVATGGRPAKWGKKAAIALFAVLVGGVGVLHVMPVGTKEYETAASEALGVPVKIGSARLSLITGIEMKFENVTIGGDAVKIREVRGFPEMGSLFGARKSFSRLELDGVAVYQSQLADAVLGKAGGENFRVGRVVVKGANIDGPLKLPPMDVDAVIAGDGTLQSLTLSGGDKLVAKLSPKGSEIGFEISAGSLALPVLPALSLSEFGMKGTATRQGVTSSEWDGRAFDGVISGTAKIRWGATWNVDGEVRARGLKVAVFAPALVSEGKVDGRATYSMTGSNPATLHEGARMQGEFKIEKGVLGSFDLTRALQTGGSQTGGRTVFTELTGQGVYDKGVVQITNVSIAAGNVNAGASLNIDANGGLSGRIVADVKAATQTLRATLNVSGKVQDPVIRK